MGDDEDFVSNMHTLENDEDLMGDGVGADDANLEHEVDKDNIVIEPIIENKPRTKLSFIAPRIPLGKSGFGVQNTATKAELNLAKGKSAGGIKITAIASGANVTNVSAAFSG